MKIAIQRIYEDDKAVKGYRVLVDRIWPRGMTREKAALDEWNKDLPPSTALRKWYGHDPEKWAEFSRKYLAELRQRNEEACALLKRAGNKIVLLYGARDKEHTHALVLKDYLEKLK